MDHHFCSHKCSEYLFFLRSGCLSTCSIIRTNVLPKYAKLPNQTWRRSSKASQCMGITHQYMRQTNRRSTAINPPIIVHVTLTIFLLLFPSIMIAFQKFSTVCIAAQTRCNSLPTPANVLAPTEGLIRD